MNENQRIALSEEWINSSLKRDIRANPVGVAGFASQIESIYIKDAPAGPPKAVHIIGYLQQNIEACCKSKMIIFLKVPFQPR